MKLALLLFVAACGRIDFGERADAAAGSSSTRLKQKYDVYDTTLRQPTRLYDSLLGYDCDPYATTTAGTRCLVGGSIIYYVDAACTQAVAAKEDTTPYTFDVREPTIAHIYSYGASIGTPAMAYTTQYDGTCAAVAPSAELFQLTEVAFDTFAQLTPAYGHEGRIETSWSVADDGFRTATVLHDTLVDAGCYGYTYDDRSVCSVYATDVAYYYTDNACTQVVEDAASPVQFAEHFDVVPPCKSTDIDVHALASELPRTTPVWVQIPGSVSCIQTAVGTARRLFALGPAFQLASVTRGPVGGARIQAIDVAANGAHAVDPYAVWDSQLGVECVPLTSADGMRRCVPKAPYASSAGYFSDAGCTQPITGAGVAKPTCTSQPVTYVVDMTGSQTGPRVFHAQLRLAPVYGGGPTNCTQYLDRDFYAETTEVPLDNFVVVTQQTDP